MDLPQSPGIPKYEVCVHQGGFIFLQEARPEVGHGNFKLSLSAGERNVGVNRCLSVWWELEPKTEWHIPTAHSRKSSPNHEFEVIVWSGGTYVRIVR